MSEESFIFTLVKDTEKRWGCLCWASRNSNSSGSNKWWDICIDDWELYTSEEYKQWIKEWRDKANGIGLLFCYCNPSEEKLLKLSEEGNLIMNIEE